MIRTHDQPPTEEEGNVEDAGTYDEAEYTRSREPQSEEEHVVLVKVAEEPKQPAPLAKHCHAKDDAGGVYHLNVVDDLQDWSVHCEGLTLSHFKLWGIWVVNHAT